MKANPGRLRRKLGVIAFELVCLIMMSAAGGFGTTTSLVIIPIAATVGEGRYEIQPQSFTPLPNPKATTELLGTEIGFGRRWEAGVDFSFGLGAKPYPILNGKYIFAVSKDGRRAAGVGLINLQPQMQTGPFVVGSNDLGTARVHLGAIGSKGHLRWFTGVDSPINERIILMADYTSGRGNFSSVGIDYRFNPRWDLLLGLQFPNTSGDTVLSLQFTFGSRYVRTAKTNKDDD